MIFSTVVPTEAVEQALVVGNAMVFDGGSGTAAAGGCICVCV